MHPPRRPGHVRHVPGDRTRHDPQIQHVRPDRHEPRDDRPLCQARHVVRIPARHHLCPALEKGPKGGPQACRKLRRYLRIRQPRYPARPEKRPGPLRSPDKAHRHLRAPLRELIRPDPDVRHHRGVLIQQTPVTHHRSLVDRHVALRHYVPTDRRSLDPASLAQIGPAPHYRVLHHRSRLNHTVIPHNRQRTHLCPSTHAAPMPDQHRRLQARRRVHQRILPNPHPISHPLPRHLHRNCALQAILVRGAVLVQTANVRPVSLRHISAQQLPLSQQRRIQILAEVDRTLRVHPRQHLGLQDVDPRVHRVREHLPSARLLQKALHPPLLISYHDPVLQRIRHPL